MWVQEPKHLGHSPWLSQAISGELDQKWNSREWMWCSCGILEQRTEECRDMSPCQPLDATFGSGPALTGASI